MGPSTGNDIHRVLGLGVHFLGGVTVGEYFGTGLLRENRDRDREVQADIVLIEGRTFNGRLRERLVILFNPHLSFIDKL